ncbi:stress protein [Brevibacterium sp. JNUCC-42]|nr:stress protein [Brevibacterium sp. JNUCC-42]
MSTMKKFVGITLAGVIGLGGLGMFAPANASAAENPINLSMTNQENSKLQNATSANLNVTMDGIGIANKIRYAIDYYANRPGFVKNVMESTFHYAGQQYNVMVSNLNQGYVKQISGVKFYGSINYNGINYGIWVFEEGEFANQGNNWAFRGWFDLDGGHVKFYRP